MVGECNTSNVKYFSSSLGLLVPIAGTTKNKVCRSVGHSRFTSVGAVFCSKE